MDRDDCVLFVNSTPAYYYILPLFFRLLRRYAPSLKWAVILATEEPWHPVCQEVSKKFGVELLTIPQASKGFLESRLATLEHLLSRFTYCFPLQEDFLLEMPMDRDAFVALFSALDRNPLVASARCMPCPGPSVKAPVHSEFPGWKTLGKTTDQYGFTFQATLWRTVAAAEWYGQICATLDGICSKEAENAAARRKTIELTENLAENPNGQHEFWAWSAEKNYEHLAFERAGPQPNAVYLSPFPYRPTAIVRGRLEPWAEELARREGVPIQLLPQ